jgi:hypothetical protein
MGTNTQVLGERGAGKSSLLQCAQVVLRKKAPNLLPVLVSYCDKLESRADAYRYFLAATQAELIQLRGTAAGGIEFQGRRLTGEAAPDANLQKLREVDQAMLPALFSSFLESLTRQQLGVVLMIDEYEYFLHKAFRGDIMGFWELRQFATHTIAARAPKLLTVVLAGAKDWAHLCADRVPSGSPVHGMVTNRQYVGPITLEDFAAMWQQCLADSDREVCEFLGKTTMSVEQIYDLVGGWPFYGKVIGQHLITYPEMKNPALLEQLEPLFQITWNERAENEQEQLLAALEGRDIGYTRELSRRGLLEQAGGNFRPRGKLWSLYLNQLRHNQAQPPHEVEGTTGNAYIFRRSGQYYEIWFNGQQGGHFKAKGFRIIHRLLRFPHKTIPALQLQEALLADRPADLTGEREKLHTHSSSFQPKADKNALEAARKRINDLKGNIRLAKEAGEHDTLERYENEYENEYQKLYDYICDSVSNPEAFLQGNKPKTLRRLGKSDDHDVMEAVRKNLENAYRAMQDNQPPLTELIEHLKKAIEHQAHGYAYCPANPPLPWKLD